MDITDLAIAYTSIIFVMSTISERVANFTKLYFQDKVIYIPVIPHRESGKWVYSMKARLAILAQQQVTEAAEKEREYRILVINIIVGILCAAFINLNIFELNYSEIQNSNLNLGWQLSNIKGWKFFLSVVYFLWFLWSVSAILFSKLQETKRNINEEYIKYPFYAWLIVTIVIAIVAFSKGDLHSGCGKLLTHFSSYLCMGVFLSMGSKFWHDLLDILFSFKRTQEKLSDPKLLTDFDSADQIIRYTEISQYNIAEQLYDKYRSQIWAIKGVVSCGLVTYFNERIKLYQKRIEVEFTNNTAQNELLKLNAEGEVTINYNTFYLRDYIQIKHTSDLIAVPDVGIDNGRICYARNEAASNENIKGSFNVKKTAEGKYIAFSCLHVFASEKDFNDLRTNEKATIHDRQVLFSINGSHFHGQIILDTILFGIQSGGYGVDYCECEVEEEVFNKYENFIRQFDLRNVENLKMKLFGATSKLLVLDEPKTGLVGCDVNYGNGFTKHLELFKVDVSNPKLNVNPGDSGSTVYYKSGDNKELSFGMIIAKSDDCAYMFKLGKLNISYS